MDVRHSQLGADRSRAPARSASAVAFARLVAFSWLALRCQAVEVVAGLGRDAVPPVRTASSESLTTARQLRRGGGPWCNAPATMPDANGHVTISEGTLEIPECAPNGCYNGCTALKTISLPSTLTKIDAKAFQKSGLTSVVIPNSVNTINGNAFSQCADLAAVTLSSGLITVESGIFSNCVKLTSVTIPAIKTIGPYMFNGCSQLMSVTLPSTIETIGTYAFKSTGLTSVVLTPAMTSIDLWAFDEFCSPDGNYASWTPVDQDTPCGDCNTSPCKNGGQCSLQGISYRCDCINPGWRGTNCNIAVSKDCADTTAQGAGGTKVPFAGVSCTGAATLKNPLPTTACGNQGATGCTSSDCCAVSTTSPTAAPTTTSPTAAPTTTSPTAAPTTTSPTAAPTTTSPTAAPTTAPTVPAATCANNGEITCQNNGTPIGTVGACRCDCSSVEFSGATCETPAAAAAAAAANKPAATNSLITENFLDVSTNVAYVATGVTVTLQTFVTFQAATELATGALPGFSALPALQFLPLLAQLNGDLHPSYRRWAAALSVLNFQIDPPSWLWPQPSTEEMLSIASSHARRLADSSNGTSTMLVPSGTALLLLAKWTTPERQLFGLLFCMSAVTAAGLLSVALAHLALHFKNTRAAKRGRHHTPMPGCISTFTVLKFVWLTAQVGIVQSCMIALTQPTSPLVKAAAGVVLTLNMVPWVLCCRAVHHTMTSPQGEALLTLSPVASELVDQRRPCGASVAQKVLWTPAPGEHAAQGERFLDRYSTFFNKETKHWWMMEFLIAAQRSLLVCCLAIDDKLLQTLLWLLTQVPMLAIFCFARPLLCPVVSFATVVRVLAESSAVILSTFVSGNHRVSVGMLICNIIAITASVVACFFTAKVSLQNNWGKLKAKVCHKQKQHAAVGAAAEEGPHDPKMRTLRVHPTGSGTSTKAGAAHAAASPIDPLTKKLAFRAVGGASTTDTASNQRNTPKRTTTPPRALLKPPSLSMSSNALGQTSGQKKKAHLKLPSLGPSLGQTSGQKKKAHLKLPSLGPSVQTAPRTRTPLRDRSRAP